MKSWLVVTLMLIVKLAFANGFEGSITMIRQSVYDTTYYTYYVSKDRIRIEEKNNRKELQRILLINIAKEDVFVIDPVKKMYTKLRKLNEPIPDNRQFVIRKLNNYKIINGVKCYQWRVKNQSRNTEVTYWVAQYDFDFFEKMVKILNYTDRSWDFFSIIPNNQGFFPMLSVERTLLREEKMRTAVLKIEKRAIDSSFFKIPKGYIYFVM